MTWEISRAPKGKAAPILVVPEGNGIDRFNASCLTSRNRAALEDLYRITTLN